MKAKFAAAVERLPLPPWAEKALKVGGILVADMNRADLFKHASAMAYVTLLSIIPSLAATFALMSLFKPLLGQESNLILQAKDFILSNLASGSGEQVIQHLDSFLSNLDFKRIGITGFAGLLVSLILLLRQIELALNRIWLVQTARSLFKRFVYFWTFLTLGGLIISLAVGIVSQYSMPQWLMDAHETTARGGGLVSAITPLIGGFVFFALLYKVVPNTFVSWKEASVGATVATLLFNLGGKLYGFYIANLAGYQAVYGAFAALPLFLLWLYISWIIILLGSVIAWRLQQGFVARKNEIADEFSATTSAEKLRNLHIQTILPYLALIAIHLRFKDGSGKGLSAQELSETLNLPLRWFKDALEGLTTTGAVVASAQRRESDDEDDWTQQTYFPATPADKVLVSHWLSELANPTLSWIRKWHHDFPINFRQTLDQLMNASKQQWGEFTLDDLIVANPDQRA